MQKDTCDKFNICGGCSLPLSYPEQIEFKKKLLYSLFGADIPLEASVKQPGYRHRMDFVYYDGKLGLRAGRWDKVLDIDHCLLMPEEANELLSRVRSFVFDFPYYDLKTHQGFLRYVVIKSTLHKSAIQTMLCMVVSATCSNFNALINKLQEHCKKLLNETHHLKSVHFLLNNTKSDVSFGDLLFHIGDRYIVQDILGKQFFVGPNTFLQSNIFMIDKLYSFILSNVNSSTVLDLFCGIGTITLSINKVRDVVGVEINKESIELANLNKAHNNIPNVEFVNQDAFTFLRDLVKGKLKFEKFENIIVDPPRAGLSKRFLRYLNDCEAKRIIWVSCNPKNLAQSIGMLTNYKLSCIKAFDMFPNTKHVEVVAVLDRI